MKSSWKLMVLDSQEKELFNGAVTSLPLNDALIIQKSIEFFDDEAPCFIHRSAVMKRLYMELEEFITRKYNENPLHTMIEFAKEDTPSNIRLILDGCGDMMKMRICR